MAGVINKIRARAGLVVGVIALALGAFLLNDIISNFFDGSGNLEEATTIAYVHGERVDARAYDQMVDQFTQLLSAAQSGQTPDREQMREYVWGRIITNSIRQRQLERVGASDVSQEELRQMYMGPNFAPDLMQRFNTQDPAQIQQIMQRANQEPGLFAYLQWTELQLIDARLQERQSAIIRSGAHVSKAQARRQFLSDRRTATGQVLMVNYGTITDTAARAQLSEQDFLDYYNENKERFRQTQATASISYVSIPVAPTSADSAKILATVTSLAQAFRNTANDSAFAIGRSGTAATQQQPLFDFQWKPLGEFDFQTQQLIAGGIEGDVYGPLMVGNALRLVKLSGRSTADSLQKVQFRHVQVPNQADSAATVAFANAWLDSLRAPGADFAAFATRNTADPNTRMSGGMLGSGWLDRNSAFGPDFYTEVSKGRPGQLLGPLRSPQGLHLVRIEGRSTEVFRVATLGYDIVPSTRTLDSLRQVAATIQEAVRGGKSFEDALAANRMPGAVRSQALTSTTRAIPGVQGQQGVTELVRFGLSGKMGDVLEREVETENALIIAKVDAVSDGEFQSLDAVRPQIERIVLNRVKARIINQRLANVLTGGQELEAVRTAYGQGALVQPATNVSFAANAIPGVGNEPRVLGALFGTPVNKNSAPIEGTNGVYVVRPSAHTQPQAPSEQELAQFRENMQRMARTSFPQKVQSGINDAAGIKDFRYRFQ